MGGQSLAVEGATTAVVLKAHYVEQVLAPTFLGAGQLGYGDGQSLCAQGQQGVR